RVDVISDEACGIAERPNITGANLGTKYSARHDQGRTAERLWQPHAFAIDRIVAAVIDCIIAISEVDSIFFGERVVARRQCWKALSGYASADWGGCRPRQSNAVVQPAFCGIYVACLYINLRQSGVLPKG